MLVLKNITFTFDKKEKRPLIKNLSFSVKNGQILLLKGKSGLGKSTLLNIISGFCEENLIWTGKIFLNNQEINNLSIQRRKIGYVLQDYFLFPHLSVKNNLLFALKKNSNYEYKFIKDLLENVGLIEIINKFPSELSGGQKARIACLRALISKPNALLLDEPFAGLDYKTKRVFEMFVNNQIKNLKIPCIIVSHQNKLKNNYNEKLIDLNKYA